MVTFTQGGTLNKKLIFSNLFFKYSHFEFKREVVIESLEYVNNIVSVNSNLTFEISEFKITSNQHMIKNLKKKSISLRASFFREGVMGGRGRLRRYSRDVMGILEKFFNFF